MIRLKWDFLIFILLYFCRGSHQERKGPQGRQAVVSSTNAALNAPVCAQPLYTAVISDTVTPGTFILRVVAIDPSGGTVQYSIQDSAFQRFSINSVTGDITVSNNLQRRLTRSAVEIRVRATQTGGSRLYCESTVRVNILPSAIYLGGAKPGGAAGSGYAGGVPSTSSAYGSATAYGAPSAPSGGYGAASSGGYGGAPAAPSGGYGAAPSGGYGGAPAAPSGGYGGAPAAPSGGYGGAPAAPSGGYGGAPAAPSGGYGAAPSGGYGGAPAAPGGGYGGASAAPSGGYGAAPSGGYGGAPAAPSGGYGAAPSGGYGGAPAAPGGGYGGASAAPSGGYGAAPSGGYGGAPAAPSGGYGAAPSGGYGGAPAAPSGGYGATPSAPSGGYGAAPSGGYGGAPAAPSGGYGAAPSGGYGGAPAAPSGGYGSAPSVAYRPAPTPPQYAAAYSQSVSVAAPAPVYSPAPVSAPAPGYASAPTASVYGITAGASSAPIASYSSPGVAVSAPTSYGSPSPQPQVYQPASQPIIQAPQPQVYQPPSQPIIQAPQPQVYQPPSQPIIQAPQPQVYQPPSQPIIQAPQPQTYQPPSQPVIQVAPQPQPIISQPQVPPPSTPPCSPAQFTQPTYNFQVTSCSLGSNVGTVSASGNSVSYLISGNPAYTISPQTGQITLASQLMENNQNQLTVTANSACGMATALVLINPNCAVSTPAPPPPCTSPQFTQQFYNMFLSTCTQGTSVGTVQAISSTGGVSYSLQGSNSFTINPSSGQVQLSQTFTGTTQTLTVTASNNCGSATATITISANCQPQGSPPVFSQSTYSTTVTNCQPGGTIGTVSANSLSGGLVTYALQGTSAYTVNPSSGTVTSVSQLPSGTTTFTVVANNQFGSATATISVAVSCQQAAAQQTACSQPVFNQQSNNLFIYTCIAGTQVGSPVTASSSSGLVTYSLQGTTFFSIDASTGQLTTSTQLPSSGYQSFTVVANNQCGSAQTTVTVTAYCQSSQPQSQGQLTSASGYGRQMPPMIGPPMPATQPAFFIGPTAQSFYTPPQQSPSQPIVQPVILPQPVPAPSYSAPAQAPAPIPSYSVPAPSYSSPAPAPSYAAPAPVYQPPVSAPSPVYSLPAPAPAPQSYSPPVAAAYSAPAPIYSPPAPQPSYSAPAPSYSPAPAPSYSAPAPMYSPPQPSYSAPVATPMYSASSPSYAVSLPGPAYSTPAQGYGAAPSMPAYSAPAPIYGPQPQATSMPGGGSSGYGGSTGGASYGGSAPASYGGSTGGASYGAPAATSYGGSSASYAAAPTSSYSGGGYGSYGSAPSSCGQQFYTTTVFESTAAGTPILILNGTSPTGAPLYWSIIDNPLGRFRIDTNTGTLTVAGTLTRRFVRSAMEIRVRGSDYTTGSYCDSTVRINVLPDANITQPSTNRPPRFSQTNYAVTLPCSATTGVLVGTASATDPDGNAITYSMSSPQFTVDNSGNVRTAIPFLNSTASTSFIILATDTGGATGSATVSVTVVGTCNTGGTVGNLPPAFSQPSYSFTIPCSTSTGQLVGTVPAFDPNGNPLTYSVSTTLFNIDTNGNIRTTVPFQTGASSTLFTVAATDSNGLSGSATVTVSISPTCTSNSVSNNGLINIQQGPTCQQNLYTATVLEGTAVGTFVLQVNATSPTGSSIVWSIPDNPLGRFQINPSTGAISVATALSRRGRAALEFTVRGTDVQTGLYCQSTVRINIIPNTTSSTSNNPQFSSANYFLASQCTGAIGQFIGYIVATSPTGATLTYSINSTQFQINPTTGQITTAVAITIPGIQVVTVTAADSNGLSSTATVTINVIGPCTQSSTITVTPTSFGPISTCTNNLTPAGTTVGTIMASGGSGTYTYSIMSGNFAISSPMGVITTTAAMAGVQNAVVVVTDTQGNTATVTVTVTLCTSNSLTMPSVNLPIYSTDARCASGSITPGTVLGTVSGSGGTPTYSYALTPADPRFNIDPATGQITAATTLTPGTYLTTVTTTDLAGTTASGVITINACVATTLLPSFTPPTVCLGSTSGVIAGQNILNVTGIQGSGSGYTFSTTSNQFAISTTGFITATAALGDGIYSVPITVTDSLGQTSTQLVTVTITANPTCAVATGPLTATSAGQALSIGPDLASQAACTGGGFLGPGASFGPVTVTGGTPPYTFTTNDGSGILTSGSILAAANSPYDVLVTVTDAAGNTITFLQPINFANC